MAERLAQTIRTGSDGRRFIEGDWYPHYLPHNVVMSEMVYPDTSYSFASFYSRQPGAFQMGYASGNYGHSNFLSGENGRITIGKYVILEATTIICNGSVSIGDHCMFSWGSVVSDSWLDETTLSPERRKSILVSIAKSGTRYLNYPATRPVVIEANVWVGFDAVIMPGVRLGRGCVVGCKTIIWEDVPPYAVVVGDPPRIVKYLEPNDVTENRGGSF